MSRSKWKPFKERPEWSDVQPLPQNDGPNPVVPISYSKQFRDTMDYVRAILAKDERSRRALDLISEAIGLNSANYTIWHYRRLILEALDLDVEEELSFMEEIADSNHKNYQFCEYISEMNSLVRNKAMEILRCVRNYFRQHRRWVAQKRGSVAVADELRFTEVVLNDDAKNYHAWSHRQWVLSTLGGWEGELDYCAQLLKDDIYNNSAWNQRFFVITKDPSRGGLQTMLESEVSYSLSAIGEAPANESSWRYLRGLFKDDKEAFVARSDVVAVCLQQLASKQGEVHALNLLLDLLGYGYKPTQTNCSSLEKVFGSWTSIQELAGLVCLRLKQVDSIRSKYWAWRQTLLSQPAL